jgi:hypothetical protein
MGALEAKKRALRITLGRYCISDQGCYNREGAKDYLRTYCCSIFDLLLDAYREKVAVYDWEEQIAEEAIRNTAECWNSFNGVYPQGSGWVPVLREAIIQHLGRPIRQRLQKAFESPANTSASGLLIMAQTQSKSAGGQLITPPQSPKPATIGEILRQLLDESRLRPEDIAEEINIEARNVYRHLAGETTPSLVNVGKYERALSKHLGRPVRLPTPEKRRNVSKTSAKRQ